MSSPSLCHFLTVVKFLAAVLVAASFWIIGCGTNFATEDRPEEGTDAMAPTVSMPPENETYLIERELPEGGEVLLPRQKSVEGVLSASAAAKGKLVVGEGGCLRRKYGDESGDVLIWPPGYELAIQSNVIRVLDESGEAVAQVGDRIQIGGGYLEKPLEGNLTVSEQLARELPERCPGSYWIMGEPVRVIEQ